MKAVVTGGAGFIGHHLVNALVQRGDHVTIVDNMSSGRLDRLPVEGDRANFVRADVRDEGLLERALSGSDVVFHLAALTSVAGSFADQATTHDVNAGGTAAVLRAAARVGTRSIVLASSAAVYGDGLTGDDLGRPLRETDPLAPASPYAASKAEAEAIVAAEARRLGVSAVVLRYFNVYGTGQNPNAEYAAAVPAFIVAALRGEPAVIHGDGAQRRDFVHVSDVVAANLLAADLLTADLPTGNQPTTATDPVADLTFNIGSGRARSIAEVHAAVAQATGTLISPTFEATRPGDVRASSADISRAAARLGYRVRMNFNEGVQQTVDGYRAGWNPGEGLRWPESAPAAPQTKHLPGSYREAS